MKKLLSFMSALAICAAAVPVCASAEGGNYDFNGDGAVNGRDIGALRGYIAMMEDDIVEIDRTDDTTWELIHSDGALTCVYAGFELTEAIKSNIEANGDANGDGKITYDDVYTLQNRFFEDGIFQADIDEDGKLNANDSGCVLAFYAINQTSYEETIKNLYETDALFARVGETCDFNGDGSVDAQDASILLSYISTLYEIGDANLDGIIDASDASLILRWYAAVQTGDEEIQNEISAYAVSEKFDADGDGEITAIDSSCVLKIYCDRQTGAN
ncbi:MAG: dockerin type I domain-containing protein [Oscillospiraceae bacterium]|nr:dockerin type I domain-containing protein [Oscillospiraceae bacterium]